MISADAPTTFGGLTLDPFQRQAIGAVCDGHTVIVAAPTGAGKTVIAEFAIHAALEGGHRVIYTSPIKALSNQKFRDFSVTHGDKIGLVTGDVSLNPDAPIVIMTTEIFRNAILESPERYADVRHCIFDEVHYINDAERGTVWEESIIFAPQSIRFIALSATIPNIVELAGWLEEVRESPVTVVTEYKRPVPLEFAFYSDRDGVIRHDELKKRFRKQRRFTIKQARRSGHAILDHCAKGGQTPSLYFAFSRNECEAKAWHSRHRRLLTREEGAEVRQLVNDLARRYGVKDHLKGTRCQELWHRGIAYHHAGMLPMFKEIVERLFTHGLIKMLFATETFALGINMPACAVVFDALEKYDGIDFRPIKALEFQQMAGRAGRRGMDERGYVYINLDSLEDVSYRQLRQIISGRAEPVTSQLNMGYSTILNLLGRLGEEIFCATEQSLGEYQQRQKAKAQTHAARERQGRRRREQLEGKIALLGELGYLDDEKALTSKGRFAARIQGYEIPVCELLFAGDLEGLDKDQLAVVFGALVFEGKKRTWFTERYDGLVRPLSKVVTRRVRWLRKLEGRFDIAELSKPPDFSVGGVMYAWSQGARLDEVTDLTSLSAGDLIRTIRLTIQLLRQVKHASRGHDAFTETLGLAVAGLKRDEADAESQLRVN